MTLYKPNINYTPHNFVTSTLMFDNSEVAQSVSSFSFEKKNDEADVFEVGDSTAIINEFPSQAGTFTIEILDASPTTDYLWDLFESGDFFTLSFSDSNAPKLKVNASQCRFQKSPSVSRGKEAAMVTWTIVSPYAKGRGGSYRLVEE